MLAAPGARLAYTDRNINVSAKGLSVNKQLKLLCAALSLSCGFAHAGVIQTGGTPVANEGKVSAQPNVCTVNFNGGNAANTCGATYLTGANTNHFVTGNSPGNYATPVGDTSGYFTVGPASGNNSVTINLATSANYFGFYAGSLDTFNLVQFFLGNTLVDSFTGAQINAVAFPSQPTNGNQAAAEYIDYFLQPNAFYDRIVYSSTSNAFETDNHAFGLATPRGVPEPESVALLALGALALVARRRRSA